VQNDDFQIIISKEKSIFQAMQSTKFSNEKGRFSLLAWVKLGLFRSLLDL
jgi:hypothetical protein